NGQLEHIGGRRSRKHFPQKPQHWLRHANRPDRTVEIPPFVGLVLGGRLHARKGAERTEQPDRDDDGEVSDVVELAQAPAASRDSHNQTRDVQQREGDHLTPRDRVADAPIQRIRAILGKPDDVRPGLDTGEPAAKAGDARTHQHHTQPQRHPRVEAALEKIERQRPWSDKKHKDPDRPVSQPIADLVPLANLAVARKLNTLGVPEGTLVRRGKNAAPQTRRWRIIRRSRSPHQYYYPPKAEQI